MQSLAILSGAEVTIAFVILFFFLVSIAISLSVKNRDVGNQDLEHWDHEHGETDAR